MMTAFAIAGGNMEKTREQGPPRAELVTNQGFDDVIGCLSEAAASKHDLRYLPTGKGGSFFFTQAVTFGGRSSMLIDVDRGDPVKVRIWVTGGPWLGRGDKLVRRVQSCMVAENGGPVAE